MSCHPSFAKSIKKRKVSMSTKFITYSFENAQINEVNENNVCNIKGKKKKANNSPSFWASPNHLLIKFDILTLMKTAPDSLAIALASIVFPVPGGPYNRTPF